MPIVLIFLVVVVLVLLWVLAARYAAPHMPAGAWRLITWVGVVLVLLWLARVTGVWALALTARV